MLFLKYDRPDSYTKISEKEFWRLVKKYHVEIWYRAIQNDGKYQCITCNANNLHKLTIQKHHIIRSNCFIKNLTNSDNCRTIFFIYPPKEEEIVEKVKKFLNNNNLDKPVYIYVVL